MLEVLGFHRLDTQSKRYFENVFYSLAIIPISEELHNAAITLRQQRKLSAGDSLIAATALHYDYSLYTRNTGDFDWIPNLQINNPIL